MRLKELRERDHLSQAELARMLQVSSSTVSSWERGLTTPSQERLKQIAALFNVTQQYLLGNEEARISFEPYDEFETLTENELLRKRILLLQQENRRLSEEINNVAVSHTNTLFVGENVVRELHRQQKKNKVLTAICVLCVVFFAVVLLNPTNKEAELQKELSAALKEKEKMAEQVESLSSQVVSLAAKLTKTVPTASSASAALRSEDATIMVWIPDTGRKYHDSERCAGNNPTLVTLAEAKARGYTSCGRCKPPY